MSYSSPSYSGTPSTRYASQQLTEPLLSRTAFSPPASQPGTFRLPSNTFSTSSIAQHTSSGFLPPTLRLYPGSPPLARAVPNLPQPSFRVLFQHYLKCLQSFGIRVRRILHFSTTRRAWDPDSLSATADNDPFEEESTHRLSNDLAYLCYSYLENLEDQTFPSLLILLLSLVLLGLTGGLFLLSENTASEGSCLVLLWFALQFSRHILLMLCVNCSAFVVRNFGPTLVISFATLLFALQAFGYLLYLAGWGILTILLLQQKTPAEGGRLRSSDHKLETSSFLPALLPALTLFLAQLAETVLLGVRGLLALAEAVNRLGPIEEWCPARMRSFVTQVLLRPLSNVTGELSRGGGNSRGNYNVSGSDSEENGNNFSRIFLQTILRPPFVSEYASYLDDGSCARLRDSEEACPVCYDEFGSETLVLKVPCDGEHVFHQKCAKEWFQRGHRTCPVCRMCLADRVLAVRGERALREESDPETGS